MLRSRLASIGRGDDRGFEAAIAALQECDVVTANLEMPLSRRGSKMLKHSNLRSDPEIIDDVREMGIHTVSLANNHLMDYGPDALLDTVTACENAGIASCGAGANLEAAMAPAWLEAGNKRIAFLSVSSTLPLGSEATEGTPGIAPIRINFSLEIDTNLINEQPGTMPVVHSWTRKEDEEAVLSRIRALKAEADAVIVAIHWGVPSYWLSPYQGLLAEYQQPLGHSMIDAGADIIFGHHSHSLHGIEVYQGKPIFYSAGNFVFEQPRGFMEPESFIAQARFGDELAIDLVPLMVDDRGLPELATGDQAREVIEKLTTRSDLFGTQIQMDEGRARLVMS
jgi:poly-gamma-glutamate capsule biosynthesis protein CapA/YwtB (metallophosphatase superfamily)